MPRKNPVQKEVEKLEVAPRTATWRTRIFQFYVLLAVASFIQLSLLAKVTPYFPADVYLTHALQALPNLGAVMNAISWPGYFPQALWFVGAILIFFLVLKWYWETVILMLGFAASESLVNFFKTSIGRARPLGSLIPGKSFPSGHVTDYTLVLGFLLFLSYSTLKKSLLRAIIMLLLTAGIILVGVSRIYLGAHWPSDVLGAYLLGSIVLWGAIILSQLGKRHPDLTAAARKFYRAAWQSRSRLLKRWAAKKMLPG